MNPINKFFKELKRLDDALNQHRFKDGIIATRDHDCKYNECEKFDDDLWIHRKERQSDIIFLWRIEYNYCCFGRPTYTSSKQKEIFCKSETEKILHTHDGYEFVWCWDTFDQPTRICWGLKPANFHYELRKDGEVIVSSSVKTAFKKECSEVLGIPYKEPKNRKYSIETEKFIRRLEQEENVAHQVHVELQVQIFYKPADIDNMFDGDDHWNPDYYVSNPRQQVAHAIQNDLPKFLFENIKIDKVNFLQVADFYKDKMIYDEKLEPVEQG